MDDSAFTALMFTLRPFADIHVTSLLLHHAAVFLFGLSCARAKPGTPYACNLSAHMNHVRRF
jgi:hypothetical protein